MNTPMTLQAPEDVIRTPHRPFGRLSDMAAEHLPRMIAGRAQFPTHRELILMAEEQLHRVTDETGVVNPVQDPHLGLLDAAMIERGMLNKGMTIPGALTRLVEETAQRLRHMPGISYELIVARNPADTDPRTFTDGEIGRGELEFYRRHLDIERAIARYCVQIRGTNEARAHEALQAAVTATAVFDHGLTVIKRNLSPEQFDGFRGFFDNSNRRLPGASGLFSAGIYTLDAHLAGHHPDMRAFMQTKEAQMRLYPTTTADEGFTGQADMNAAREGASRRPGLLGMVDIDRGIRAAAARCMADARRNHVSVVERFLPDVMRGKGGGTGSVAKVAEFLNKPVAVYDKIADSLSPTAS